MPVLLETNMVVPKHLAFAPLHRLWENTAILGQSIFTPKDLCVQEIALMEPFLYLVLGRAVSISCYGRFNKRQMVW